MKKQFVVIGLGRFGGSVTRTLLSLGFEVMGIDQDERKVSEFASILPHVFQADSTDDGVMRKLGVKNMDHAIVAIGGDLQASILTTLILKDIGLKHITAKATSDYHQRVLEGVGADHIVHPERDTGIRVAHRITSKNMVEYLELSPEHSLVEIIAPQRLNGKSLLQSNIRAKYGCNVMAIRRVNNELVVSPQASDLIYTGDLLVLIGSNRDINRFEKFIGE
ncbi:TrkA family potassium uptake protein [Paenibacillus sp. J5C_2022]|uniref:potassium channel family protein n=1 Tax=Paenibacillus sp. J5C2022 TaxID=2977129 RepID=UPI0021CF9AC6|nr:TrkA family potassium uptake protein [Paenibacillus sp. J5C2022]MCU6707485.1 TrkA family potassium uptake protein [Paenibacillus sp. J5C2022]